MNGAPASKLILPGITNFGGDEQKAKDLAYAWLDAAKNNTPKEIVAAAAMVLGSTVRARYALHERDVTFRLAVNMAEHFKDQR